MAHGKTEQGATIAGAVLPAIEQLDDDRARLYCDLVHNSLHDAARRALERWHERAIVAASLTAVLDEPS